MIVLDTNVLSELLRAAPADPVRVWMKAQLPSDLCTTAICEAEILYGIALMPTGRRRTALQRAVEAMFAEDFAGRVLTFDSVAARKFAQIAGDRRRSDVRSRTLTHKSPPSLRHAALPLQRAM